MKLNTKADRPQSMGSQRVSCDLATEHTHTKTPGGGANGGAAFGSVGHRAPTLLRGPCLVFLVNRSFLYEQVQPMTAAKSKITAPSARH